MNKKERIDEAARTLFLKQGFEDTSINHIVHTAKVAKGTFYTYYKDKNFLIAQTLANEFSLMLEENLRISKTLSEHQQIPWYQAYIRQTIYYYGEHPELLKLLDQGVRSRAIVDDVVLDELFQHVSDLSVFLNHLKLAGESNRNVRNRFLLLSQMMGFVCFESYVLQKPDHIDHIKPLLIIAAESLCKGDGLCV